jgi:hypothetical protein
MITQDSLVNFEYNNETLLGIVVSECDYSIRQLAHERKLPEQVFHVLASNGAVNNTTCMSIPLHVCTRIHTHIHVPSCTRMHDAGVCMGAGGHVRAGVLYIHGGAGGAALMGGVYNV